MKDKIHGHNFRLHANNLHEYIFVFGFWIALSNKEIKFDGMDEIFYSGCGRINIGNIIIKNIKLTQFFLKTFYCTATFSFIPFLIGS